MLSQQQFTPQQYKKTLNEWISCRNKIDKKHKEVTAIITTPVDTENKLKFAAVQKEIRKLIAIKKEIGDFVKEVRQHKTRLNQFISSDSLFISANLILYEFICLEMHYHLAVLLGIKYFGIVTDKKSSNVEVTNYLKKCVDTLKLASGMLNTHPTLHEKHFKDFNDILKIVQEFNGYNQFGEEHEKMLTFIIQAQNSTSPQQAYNKYKEALDIAKSQENFYQQFHASIGMCNCFLKTYIEPGYKDFQNNMEVEEAISLIDKIAEPMLSIIELKLAGKIDLIAHAVLEPIHDSLNKMAADLYYISTQSLRMIQKDILLDKKMELLVKAEKYNAEAEKLKKNIIILEPKFPDLGETIKNEMKNVEEEKEKLKEEKRLIEEEKKEAEENKTKYYNGLETEIKLLDKFLKEKADNSPRKTRPRKKVEIKPVVTSPMQTSSDTEEEYENDKDLIQDEIPDSRETLEKKLASTTNFEDKFYLNCYLGDHYFEEALKTYKNDDAYATSLRQSMKHYLKSLKSFKLIEEKSNKHLEEEKFVIKLNYKVKSLLDKTVKLTADLKHTQDDGREKAKKRKGEDWYQNKGSISPAAQARLDTEAKLERLIEIQGKIEEKMLALNLEVRKPEKLKEKNPVVYDEKTNLFGGAGNIASQTKLNPEAGKIMILKKCG